MNTSKLLPIGVFANATQLSPKALRLYAEQGILLPERIDSDTGYRYYRADQVHQARLVRLLRELDMPLADIARLQSTPAELPRRLKHHMDMLARKLAQQQSAYHAALALLRPIAVESAAEIFVRVMPAVTVVVQQFDADSTSLPARADALQVVLKQSLAAHVARSASAFLHPLSPLNTQEEITLELCLPLADGAPAPTVHACRHYPQQTLACVGVADAAGLVAAADALFDWFDRRGHALSENPLLFLHADGMELAWPMPDAKSAA